MGLTERRALKQAEEETILPAKARIKEICGVEVEVALDAASFEAVPSSMEDFASVLQRYVFDTFETALEEVCRDELGKEAVREGFKKIAIKNVTTDAPRKISFADGVYAIEDRFNLGEYFTSSQIKSTIEKGL